MKTLFKGNNLSKVLFLFAMAFALYGAMDIPLKSFEAQFVNQNNFFDPGFEIGSPDIYCAGDSSGAAPTTNQSCSSSPSLTLSIETTNPLRGSRSLKIAKPASNRQGEFVAVDFNIDNNQKNQLNVLRFDFNATSNFVFGDSGDLKVYIADKTSSEIKNVTSNAITANGKFVGIWNAGSNTQYQLLLWIPPTTTLAWDAIVDSFQNSLATEFTLGGAPPESILLTGYTSKSSNEVLFSTVAENSGRNLVSTSTVGSVSRFTALRKIKAVVTCGISNSGANIYYGIIHRNAAGSTLNQVYTSGTAMSEGNNAISRDMAPGDYVTCITAATVSNNTSTNFSILALDVYSSSAAGAVIPNTPAIMVAYKNGGSVSAATTIPSWTTVLKDSTGSFNASTGVYTVNTPGDYYVDFNAQFTASGGNPYAYIRLNGNIILQANEGDLSDSTSGASTLLPNLKAGDLITVEISLARTLLSQDYSTRLSIHKQNDAATIFVPTRFTTKYLPSNLTTSTNPISTLAFSNMTVGKYYRISAQAVSIINNANDSSAFQVTHGGVVMANVYSRGITSRVEMGMTSVSPIFQATTTTLVSLWNVSGGGGTLYGTGGAGGTFVTLEEIGSAIPGGF